MKAKKEKKKKRRMSLTSKIVLSLIGAAAVIVLVYISWYLIRYTFYRGYEKYLSSYEYETGTELSFINEQDPDVEGFRLVCENELLKLYTDTATCNVAVYDKRNGTVTYTNPVNADADTVAKSINVNYLKAHLIVSYFNEVVSTATMDSYTDAVAKGQYSYEGIENGVRYIYTIGTIGTITDSAGKVSESVHFVIPVEFRLDGDSLSVCIPSKGIEEHGAGYINRIQLVRYMGATSYEDNGYIVVPNGSGSLINFNNGKTDFSYSQYIYDIDPINANYTTLETLKPVTLPVFGICSDSRTILAEVDDGAAIATISANVSGTYNDYNFVYPSYVIRSYDNLVMFGTAANETLVMEDNFYDTRLSVRYSFLDDKHTGYSGLANYYREKLIAEEKLTPITETGDIPFYYDVIAGVKETGHILGVQYLNIFAMTTFEEAELMADRLSELGISNQAMNLQGWFNGGYYQNAPHDMKIIGMLGGKRGLEALDKKLSAMGSRLYADVSFQKITFADKGFNYSAESARYFGSGYVASFGLIDPSTLRNTASLGYRENRYNLLSPKYLNRYVEKFAGNISKVDIYGISLRDLANSLTSDKKRTNVTSREDALDIVTAQLEVLKNTGKGILSDSANAYAFPCSEGILNVPYEGNAFFIVDAQIPFEQMILHGCIDYSSVLLNDQDAYGITDTYLHLVESGTSPHYQFTWEEASRMKETALNRFCNTTFDRMADDAAAAYAYVNEALKNVRNAQITGHRIEGELRAVTYSNGVTIYVNYGTSEAAMDGVTVPAKSYKVEGR